MSKAKSLADMTVIFLRRQQSRISTSIKLNDKKLNMAAPRFESEKIFKIFFWLLLSPDKITFDEDKHQFICIKGGTLRKILCIIFNLCVPINTVINYGAESYPKGTGTLYLMLKIAYISYAIWGISLTYVVWTRMDRIADIFNEIYALKIEIEETRRDRESKKVKGWIESFPIVWMCVGLALATASIENFHTNFRIHEDGQKSDYLIDDHGQNILILHLKRAGIYLLKSLGVSSGFEGASNDLLNLLGFVYILTNTWRGICFMHMDLLVSCWALEFRRLIHEINQNFEEVIRDCKTCENAVCTKEKVQAIKTYLRFCTVLENFNEVQGLLVLTGTFAETMYVCFSSASFVLKTRKSQVNSIALLASYIPFLLSITVPADVHRLAKKFVSLMKQSFLKQLTMFTTDSDTSNEFEKQSENKVVSDAMTYIQHDLGMNLIGFQGLGFFTLSYSFFGSIITAVATYSLVILQLSDKGHDENKIHQHN